MEGNWLYTIAEQSSPLRRGGGTIGPHENAIFVGDYCRRGGTSLVVLITSYQLPATSKTVMHTRGVVIQ